jgi:hypothetical protein
MIQPINLKCLKLENSKWYYLEGLQFFTVNICYNEELFMFESKPDILSNLNKPKCRRRPFYKLHIIRHAWYL